MSTPFNRSARIRRMNLKKGSPMAGEAELNDRLEKLYHEVMSDGTVPAIVREAIKDVRNTFHEVFFGKSERGGESGAPLNPLFHDIIEAQKSTGKGLGRRPMGVAATLAQRSGRLGQAPARSPMTTGTAFTARNAGWMGRAFTARERRTANR